jgi:flagellar basal body-associated protein FliL
MMSAEAPTVPARASRRWLLLTVLLAVSAACVAWWVHHLELLPEPRQDAAEIVELETQTVALGQSRHHARIGMALVVRGEASVVEQAQTMLSATVVEVASGFDADTLRSADGSQRFREQMLAGARAVLPDLDIDRVLLTELLVQ